MGLDRREIQRWKRKGQREKRRLHCGWQGVEYLGTCLGGDGNSLSPCILSPPHKIALHHSAPFSLVYNCQVNHLLGKNKSSAVEAAFDSMPPAGSKSRCASIKSSGIQPSEAFWQVKRGEGWEASYIFCQPGPSLNIDHASEMSQGLHSTE